MPDGSRCPSCLAPVRDDQRFCGRCGRDLAARHGSRWRRSSHTDQRGRSLWRTFRPALGLWVILLVMGLVTASAVHAIGWSEPLGDLVGTVVSAAIIVIYCVRDRESIAPRLRHTGITPANWWKPPAWLLAMGVFLFAYFGLLGLIIPQYEGYLDAFTSAGWPTWTAFVLISVCPGVFEELAFRGVIQGRLEQVLGPREALVLQAAMFAVLHLSPLIFVSHFVIGLVLGHLRRTTGSLYPGIVLHMAWNATVLLREM